MRSFPVPAWSFLLADEPDAWRKNFDDAGWRPVVVPHDWSVEQPFSSACSSGTGYLPGGVGWYRAHVDLGGLGLTEGHRVRLRFRGAYKNADVWANGYHLGSRPSGHAEFSFDLTEILSYSPDDDLVVSVRVERTDLADSRWFNGTGVTRPVELEVHDAVGLAEYGTTFVTLGAEASTATVRIAQVVENHLAEPAVVTLRQELRALTGDAVHAYARTVEVPAGGSLEVVFDEDIASPRLWSDDRPNLYRLVTTLTHPGGESEYRETVGIRRFAFDPDKGFSVNGEPRTFKGVCLHEDAGCLGVAVPAEVWLRRLLTLKEIGCNAVRMAHNPHGPDLYALCDRLGLFVIDEAFDEWENPKNKWWQGHNVYPPKHEGYAKHFPAWHERDLANMVQAHKNHPSVVAWSIGNEIDYPNDPYVHPLFAEMTGNNDANKPAAERIYDPDRPDIRRLTTIANRLIDIVKATDGTRPVTLAAAFPELSSLTGLLDRLDLIGYNYKQHLYEEHHARFPDQPLLGSENGHGYREWRAVIDNDYISGQFLWTGIDYLGEAHGWPIHGSGAGLLTLAGFVKPRGQLRRSWWSDEPFVHLVTRPSSDSDWTFWQPGSSRSWEPDEPVEVLCFTNGEEVSLTTGGVEVLMSVDEEEGLWRGTVTPGADPLLAQARRGDVVVWDRLERRGPAVELTAGVWAPTWPDAGPGDAAPWPDLAAPQGERVLQVEVTLRDADGNPAADDLLVTAVVENGTLLGLENGDLADNTPYGSSSRRTLDARLVVFVRGDDSTTLHLAADGLATLTL
ncbi:MAG: beta-galactosidase [Tessaracoccus sp.]|uniref:glycoside hydrolase family 2 TIM barrel-domain containing protein n=1 Tax=Tessaracoccus sp. TaxID=1971211 RepID=UPI001EBF03CB|nr:glycoside hydrolase family 2 TIM barrel-domain containing protein [Tessaracoccus sp.]MBK7819986.1 beta-galactosidase [Tessaracoccus sp.]